MRKREGDRWKLSRGEGSGKRTGGERGIMKKGEKERKRRGEKGIINRGEKE